MFSHINIKHVFLAIAVCCFVSSKGYSQDKDIPAALYKASTVPDSLKEEANSVMRYGMDDYNVKGPGKAVEKTHYIITILNEKAKDDAVVILHYNKKFNSVGSFEMKVFDADGKLLKKYHKGDMYDGAASNDAALVSDDRFLGVGHTIASYPVTVEISYEEDISSIINIGYWNIQEPEQAIQNSYCHVSINADAGFRYLDKNTTITPKKEVAGNLCNYTWQVSNLKAFKLEEGAMKWRVLPVVRFAANKFEYYGYPGDFSNWQSFGKWQQALNADVGALSAQRIQEIKKMTDTVKTDKGKAKLLYKYMQQSMRYVNIQLGIGGLKPLPATFVDEKKYGDCKALSNYMSALLKAADINSYYAVVKAGANQEPEDYSFPYDNTNHIILCIPFKSDTTWLECTSSTMPFGELGSFTENRNALLITEDGGKLVNTPKSSARENQFNSETHIILDADGGAKTQVKILSTGEYREMFVGLSSIKMDEQKQYLMNELHIKQPSSFDFKSDKDVDGIKEVNLALEYDKFCDVATGEKQFYRPLAFSLLESSVPILEKRKSDYYFDCPFQKSCVTTIDLPAGFEVEALPANTSLKFSYGNYDINYVYNKAKNQVVSTAKFILNNHVIPAAKYTEMQQYMDGIAKAQNKKLVIRKKA